MIKVLIVDDSAIVRQVLTKELSKHSDINIVGTAPDPYIAREKIARFKPDVITLDIEMPRMDGITFLKKLMAYNPIPTIIISSLTPKSSEMSMEALKYGAIDVVCKPGVSYSVENIALKVVDIIRGAVKINLSNFKKNKTLPKPPPPTEKSLKITTEKILAIGASTGGTTAIEHVLTSMPSMCPGIVIVQHMPEKFTASFARRLNDICTITVKEAVDGDSVIPGTALIAPGNFHMVLNRSGARYFVQVKTGAPVYHQRPSVEVLFNSVAKYAGKNAVGIMLTGMGADGALGMLKMKEAGAVTIAQDEKTSIVWGMPGEAVKVGAVEHIVPLNLITTKALMFTKK